MTPPTRREPSELTEYELADVLKRGVPEPSPQTDLVRGVSRRARQIRSRRRMVISAAVAAAVVLVTGVPTALTSLRSRPHSGAPATHGPAALGKQFCPDADQNCEEAVTAIGKPLRLPSVAPGQPCPVSPTRTTRGVEGMAGKVRATGTGPLYLAGPMTVELPKTSTSDPAKGWRALKVIWMVDRTYTGPLLLRGARIDAPGELRFVHYLGAAGYGGGRPDGKAYPVLVYVRHGMGTPIPSADAYPSYPSGIFAKTPGCYAIQVDGVGFSEHLVFRAVVR